MKITKEQLQKMIKEVLSEQDKVSPDSQVHRSLRRAVSDLRDVEGLINYRLHGEGAMKDRDDGVTSLTEPFLSTFDKQQAELARQDINHARQLISRALKAIDKLDLGYS